MARINGPIKVWNRNDTVPTDAEGGFAGGDSTAAALGTSLNQSSKALGTVDNLAVTASTLDYGQEATATISGTSPWKTIHVGIPKGMPDDVGQQLATAAQSSADAAAQSASDVQTALQAKFMTQDEGVATLITNEAAGPNTQAALQARERHVLASDYGVVADGVTNDGPSIAAALTAADGRDVLLPEGVVQVNSMIAPEGASRLIGQGPGKTTIRSSIYRVFYPAADALGGNHFHIEGVTLDGLGAATRGIEAVGSRTSSITARDCVFQGFTAHAVRCSALSAVTVTDCTFQGVGHTRGNGVTVDGGCSNVSIRNNTFRYLQNHVIIPTTSARGVSLDIAGNVFDGGWTHMPAYFTNSGASVSYTATTVTDTTAAFGSPVAVNSTVRLEDVAASGTATYTSNTVTDVAAAFTATGLIPGHIVRTGSAFGIVSAVVSDTQLAVEEWLDDDTRLPVETPAGGAYEATTTLYGKITSVAPQTITVQRWFDWLGNDATPAATATYHANQNPAYPLLVNAGYQQVRVIGNVFKRGWADQCSLWGEDMTVVGNVFMDGQDMGLTIDYSARVARNVAITGNVARHNGTSGIWIEGCVGGTCVGNALSGNGWVVQGTTYTGAIKTYQTTDFVIGQNTILSEGGTRNTYGVSLDNGTHRVKVIDNHIDGSYTTAYAINGTVSGIEGSFLDGQTVTLVGGAGTALGNFVGSGAPTMSAAADGSTYRRTDGAAGSTFYVRAGGAWSALA